MSAPISHHLALRRAVVVGLLGFALILAGGTWKNPNFWRTATQRGDALARGKMFADAAKVYPDPWHIGVAQYRAGSFEDAAKTFARMPGATGAYDQGNAWLMRGSYDKAIASYDRALALRPDWKDAIENKELAAARKAKMDASGKHRAEESADAYKPDEVVMDQKGDNKKSDPNEPGEEDKGSDEAFEATWLRRVKTTPGDFLKAKFAYQASHENEVPPAAPAKGGGK